MTFNMLLFKNEMSVFLYIDNATYSTKSKNIKMYKIKIYKIKIFYSGPFSFPRRNYC